MQEERIRYIVIAQKYLNKRALHDLRLDELASTMDVEYWDVSDLIGSPMGESDYSDKEERSWERKINSYKELKNNLSGIPSNSIIAIYTYLQQTTYSLYKKIAEYVKCVVLLVDNSTFWNDCSAGHTKLDEVAPVDNTEQEKGETNKSFFKRLKSQVYKIEILQKIIKYCRFLGDERYKQWKDQYYAHKIMESFDNVYFVGMSQNADYRTCSPHFDEVLAVEEKSNKSARPFIVFLDSYYPMHSDLKKWVPNFNWDALREPYFNSLNAFFDRIEKQYDCEVIIGAHPNAVYKNNPYGNRKCVKFKSVELVKGAKAVMMHAGGTVTVVAYCNKPFCFMTNDAFQAGDFPSCPYGVTKKMAEVLHMPLVDTDHAQSVDGIFKKIEPELRRRFLDCYFGDCSKSKTYAEQLEDALVDIHKRIK